jgi:hypothetical protein
MIRERARNRGRLTGLVVMAMMLVLLPATAGAQDLEEVAEPDAVSVVTLVLEDQAALVAVVDAGFDLDHNVEPVGDGFTVTAIVTNAEMAELEAMGVGIDVEAKSSDGSAADLTIEWDAGPGTDIGDGGTAQLNDFVDAGQYLYHRGQFELGGQSELTIGSGSAAGTYVAVESSFGSPIDVAGTTGTVELVSDGTGDPTLGCSSLVGFTPGNVALFDRGSCPSWTRSQTPRPPGPLPRSSPTTTAAPRSP